MTIENLPAEFQPAKTFAAGKTAYLVQLTDEQVASVTPIVVGRVQSPEERQVQQSQRKIEAQLWKEGLQARLAKAHPALQPVIAHHSPYLHTFLISYTCEGCDRGAYADDDPEWPCSTIELILEGLD